MSRSDSPLRDRVIFLVGARRSGTNWLERILTAHPAVVAVPTETYLFSHGVQPFTEQFQHSNPGAAIMGRTFVTRDALVDGLRDLVDRVLLETLEREDPQARYIVERTPWHASHLPLIAEVYPDAWVINILRDGRDVARSLVSMPWGPQTLEEAAEEWRKSVQDARDGAGAVGDRYLEVIYETLLGDPRAQITALLAKLGLELSDVLWQTILTEAGSAFNVDPASPRLAADKWRKELSPAEIRAIERVAGRELRELGYDLVEPEDAGISDRVRAVAANGRPRRLARTLAKPREAARLARNRRSARHRHAVQVAHNQTVSDFERLVAEGDYDAARDLLSPRLWTRIDDGDAVREYRRGDAIDALIDALRGHREIGMTVMSGEFHSSPHDLTTVATYDLADGRRWMRTVVYRAHGGRLTNVALYRRELRVEAGASAK